MTNLTPSEQRLTNIARRCTLRALGINDGYRGNVLRVEFAAGQYRPVAGDCFGRALGTTVKAAEATLRSLVQ